MLTKCITHIVFDVPKSSFGEHKLVRSSRIFVWGELSSFRIHIAQLEYTPHAKSNWNIQNLRFWAHRFGGPLNNKLMGSANEDVGRPNKYSGTYFQKHFSNERSPNRVLTYVKSALKIRSQMFVRPSNIFVCGPHKLDNNKKKSNKYKWSESESVGEWRRGQRRRTKGRVASSVWT